MQCPACAAENRAGVRFCEECGARWPLLCPSCGAEIIAGKRFCGNCGARLAEAGDPLAGAAPPAVAPVAPVAPKDERRWATVVFVDLSGFTAIAERLDHEDVKALADSCAERVTEEVRRFGGTVINVMGDAVLAVFGAPVAHEDDAERAVRAGLAIRECALARHDDPASRIQVHVGINTGEVMAGALGPRERRDYTVMGDTVNTAARLMAAAGPGTVLVGEETYRATGRIVRYQPLAPIAVKGKERPVPVWEALDVAPVPEARPLGSAPLVGRADELALLAGLWAKVLRDSRPHLVTVLGEPGIGKSRLAAELERSALGGAAVLHGRCLPYGEALGYWALTTMVKQAAGITADDDPAAARARLGRLVADVAGAEPVEQSPAEMERHLALLSGLDTAADRASGVPDQRALHASARRFCELYSHRQPVCLMFEDIHWADDALLDLIEVIAGRSQAGQILIVAQSRPELLEKRPAWGRGVREFTSLSLEPLDESSGRELVLALCRERGLEDTVAEHVGRGAGGNPLFAEELVATLAERGGGFGIPSAIKALLSARLDALPPEQRRTIQLASVLGKVFWAGGVAALGTGAQVSGHRSGQEVDAALAALCQRELLRERPGSRFRGEREYSFKHDLVRDVAYELLPRAERRTLHGRAAEWIEQAAGEHVDESLSLLAHHAVEADQSERAVGYLVRAAERARRAAAHREEAALLGQAIVIAERVAPGGYSADLLPELRARRGRAFVVVARWVDARQDLEAALRDLPPGREERRAEVRNTLETVCYWSMDIPALRRYATEQLASAEALHREDLAASAVGWLAACECADGDLDTGLARYREALDRAGTASLASAALSVYTSTLYWLGLLDEAVVRAREALRLASAAGDTEGIVQVLSNIGLPLAASGRYDEASRIFDEARRVATEHGVGTFLARSIALSAGYHLDLFDYAGHEAVAEEARDLARSASFPPTLVSAGIDLLLNYARCGNVGRAEPMVDGIAEASARAAGFHGWLWRLRLAQARAEIALARGRYDDAIQLAGSALEQSRLRRRPKYQVLAQLARAQALHALGRTHAALGDVRATVPIARRVGDPALFLRAAAAQLALDGDDALAAEARATFDRIVAALPTPELRASFEASDTARRVSRLAV